MMHNIHFCIVSILPYALCGKIPAGVILLLAEHDWLK